jgi:hypothetical protein
MRRLAAAVLVLAACLFVAGCPEHSVELGDPNDAGSARTPDAATLPQRDLIYRTSDTLERPWGIVVDADNAYITGAGSHGRVLQIPLDGAPNVFISHDPSPSLSIAVDETHVYWLAVDAIRRAPIGGGPITALTAETLGGGFNLFALDATRVYYTTFADTVESVAKAGGPIAVLATDQAGASGIATDGTRLWWANFAGEGAIMTQPTAGGAPTLFQPVAGPRNGLAVAGGSVYYLSEGDATRYVARAPAAGGPATMLHSWSSSARGSNIAVNSTHVYFQQPDCAIGKAALDGSTFEVRSYPAALGCPNAYAVDEEHLYFTSDLGVARVPK